MAAASGRDDEANPSSSREVFLFAEDSRVRSPLSASAAAWLFSLVSTYTFFLPPFLPLVNLLFLPKREEQQQHAQSQSNCCSLSRSDSQCQQAASPSCLSVSRSKLRHPPSIESLMASCFLSGHSIDRSDLHPAVTDRSCCCCCSWCCSCWVESTGRLTDGQTDRWDEARRRCCLVELLRRGPALTDSHGWFALVFLKAK